MSDLEIMQLIHDLLNQNKILEPKNNILSQHNAI